jgi:hypothetical protein
MPDYVWVLGFVAALLVFGWIVDERKRRRRGEPTRFRLRGRRERAAERAIGHSQAVHRNEIRLAQAERIDPGTATRAHANNPPDGGLGGGGI